MTRGDLKQTKGGIMAAARNADGWEERHRIAYGEGSWERVQRLAWALAKRVIGWDPGDIDRIEEDGGRVIDLPEDRRERATRWMPAARLLALAVWRAGQDGDLLVDEVPLDRPLWWLDGAREDELYVEPLPAWGRLPRGWDSTRGEVVLESARWIATWHLMQDLAENRALRDTADGTPDPLLLLGDRCRALASGPYRDGHRPRWAGTVEHAERNIRWAVDELRAGLWTPGPAAWHAADVLHPSLTAAPDAPPLPDGVTETTWIQRAVRLTHLHTTIRAVQDHHSTADELDAHPRHPYGSALAGTIVALSEIVPTARDLEALWSRRNTSVALWERAHLPVTVREHIVALEDMTTRLSRLSSTMTSDPDEPH